jgi:hypothetical protein
MSNARTPVSDPQRERTAAATATDGSKAGRSWLERLERVGLVHTAGWRATALMLAITALGVVAITSVRYGSKPIPLGEVFEAFFAFDGSHDHLIIRSLRVPRTLIGLGVGAALGLAGGLMQGVTRNPLADPGILGVNAGASLAVVVAIFVFGIGSLSVYVWFAFVGAAAASALYDSRGTDLREAVELVRPDEPAVLDAVAGTGAGMGAVGLLQRIECQVDRMVTDRVDGQLPSRRMAVHDHRSQLVRIVLELTAIVAAAVGLGHGRCAGHHAAVEVHLEGADRQPAIAESGTQPEVQPPGDAVVTMGGH